MTGYEKRHLEAAQKALADAGIEAEIGLIVTTEARARMVQNLEAFTLDLVGRRTRETFMGQRIGVG